MGLALALYITLASGQNAVAAPDLTVTGTVSIDHPAAITVQANLPTNGIGPAKIGDLIYRGDVIQTGPDGNLGVAFADGSSFSVSPNARMEVNEFVYNPHGHFNSSLMSLTKGTFTFIAAGSLKLATWQLRRQLERWAFEAPSPVSKY